MPKIYLPYYPPELLADCRIWLIAVALMIFLGHVVWFWTCDGGGCAKEDRLDANTVIVEKGDDNV